MGALRLKSRGSMQLTKTAPKGPQSSGFSVKTYVFLARGRFFFSQSVPFELGALDRLDRSKGQIRGSLGQLF